MIADNSNSKLKILQFNTSKQQNVFKSAELILNEYDFICTQEPNTSYMRRLLPIEKNICIVGPATAQSRVATLFKSKGSNFVLELSQHTNDFFNLVEVSTVIGPLRILNVYVPCDKKENQDKIISVFRSVDTIIKENANIPLLVIGDFNSRAYEWGDSECRPNGRRALNLIFDNNMTVLNDPDQGPTFETNNGSSYIDLSFANDCLLNRYECEWKLDKSKAIKLGVTLEHIPIHIELTPWITNSNQSIQNYPTAFVEIFPLLAEIQSHRLTFCRESFVEMWQVEAERLSIVSIEEISADDYASLIIQAIHRCLVAFLKPIRKQYRQKWFNPRLARAKRSLWRQLRIMQASKSDCDKSRYRCLLKKYKVLIKKAKYDHWCNLLRNVKNYYDLPFKTAFNKLKQSKPLATIMLDSGQYTKTAEETAFEILNFFFKSDQNDLETEGPRFRAENITNNDIFEADEYIEPSDNFSSDDIRRAAANHKLKKAPGPDLIFNNYIRIIAETTPFVFTNLANKCLKTGVFPKVFKISNVILIPKKTGSSSLSDHRPISLLSNLGKLIERLIYSRVVPLILNAGFGANQFGFMENRSAEDAVNKAIDVTNSALSRKKKVIWMSFDFKGAFDTAWWPHILARLRHYKLPKDLYNLIVSYLQDRFAYILQNGKILAKKQLLRSCPQGSVLGPLLWNIAIDDLLQKSIKGVTKIAYADDLLYIIEEDCVDTTIMLAKKVCIELIEWAEFSKTKINYSKCFSMLIKPPLDFEGLNIQFNVDCEQKRIEYVQVLKYLGVLVDNQLNFGEHIKYVCNIVARKMLCFNRINSNACGYSSKMRKLVFKCAVIPNLTYCVSVWIHKIGYYIRRIVSSVRLFYIRSILASDRTSYEEVCFLSRILPIDIILRSAAIGYWRTRDSARAKKLWCKISLNDFDSVNIAALTKKEFKTLIETESWSYYYHKYAILRDKRHTEGHPRLSDRIFRDPSSVAILEQIDLSRPMLCILTGKGNFEAFLRQQRLLPTAVCRQCSSEEGTLEHHLERCPFQNAQRATVMEQIGAFSLNQLDADNIKTWLPILATLVPVFRRT